MISHGYGLNIFHEVYKTKKIENEMDFKSLILKVYESKNRGLKHLLPSSASTQLNFNFNFEAEIALFPDNTATHPPNRESSKMEQDFKYFN